MRTDDITVPCIPLQMEMSQDGSSKTLRKVRIEKEPNPSLKEENKKFYDAQDEKELGGPTKPELSKT